MNIISTHAIIHEEAKLGDNNRIGPWVYIGPGVTIGNNNVITSHASIGTPGEHKSYFDYEGKVEIGNGNTIREFVTINAGTIRTTRIGNNCILLRNSHVSHDTELEDEVTVSCNAIIGGESYIMCGANLALGCVIHQKSIIGSYSMVGMGAIVTKTSRILPGGVYVGSPAKPLKRNDIGLSRANIADHSLTKETERYWRLKGSL